jgi:hypothetical protein
MTGKPRVVSKFEGRLIGLARGIVRLTPIDASLPFLMDKIAIPPAFSADCLQLVCDSLAKGCVLYLANVGGWRRERFLHGEQPVEGRLWDRVPVAERQLVFSRHVFDFLIWLTAHHPASAKSWYPPAEELTVADRLVIFLAYDGLRDTEAALTWRHRPIFAANPLCRLMWPEDFAGMITHPPDFSGWGEGLAASILEVLQAPLTEHWLSIEVGKGEIQEWITMRQLAEAQDLVIDCLLPAINTKGRDLARFLIRAAARYCNSSVRAEHLTAGLVTGCNTRLAERFAIRRQAAVLARALDRVATWERQSRFIGYLDSDYHSAQFFLSEWDAAKAGPALIRARDLLRQLEPLAGGGGTDEPGLPSDRERVGTAVDSRD